ncbi:MAG: dTMP kinase [Candidatus Promineifilaceae bacterium]
MFITFEGSEGSGKTTQIALLADFLRGRGCGVLTTREPGGTEIGEQVRAVLHDVHNRSLTPTAEVLLYFASRAQLVEELIRPALAAGQFVVCDRYADSSLAYQGYGRGLDLDDLRQLARIATGGLQPDLTLLLDVESGAGLARRSSAGAEMNRMDLQAAVFYERVRQGYHALAAAEPARWRIINANRPLEEIQANIRRHVLERLSPGRPERG